MTKRKSDTPISDQAIREEWPRWMQDGLARLESGKLAYGDKSFSEDPLKLIEEADQELQDNHLWSFILHCRLMKLKRALTAAINRALSESTARGD